MSEKDLNQSIRYFDVRRYLTGKGATERGGEWTMECPRCRKDKLVVNEERRVWHCWHCQVATAGAPPWTIRGRGGLVDLVAVLEGVDRRAAAEKIIGEARPPAVTVREVPADSLVQPRDGRVEMPRVEPIESPEGWRPVTEVMPFMERRGITLEDARIFGLGWCDSGRYAGRMIFPVFERRHLVYFQGRAMWEAPAAGYYLKSLNPPRVGGLAVSSEVLMNLDLASRYRRVAIVEGPTDLVRSGPDTVCTFGKAISLTQIRKLLSAGVRAVDVMWDADARDAALGASRLLSSYFDTRVVVLPDGDPGDHSREALHQYRAQSVPADVARMIARL